MSSTYSKKLTRIRIDAVPSGRPPVSVGAAVTIDLEALPTATTVETEFPGTAAGRALRPDNMGFTRRCGRNRPGGEKNGYAAPTA
jgi:hypothetical protein